MQWNSLCFYLIILYGVVEINSLVVYTKYEPKIEYRRAQFATFTVDYTLDENNVSESLTISLRDVWSHRVRFLCEKFCAKIPDPGCINSLYDKIMLHFWDEREQDQLNIYNDLLNGELSPSESYLCSSDDRLCPEGRVAVVTSIFCNYDTAKPVVYHENNKVNSICCTHYYLFTDGDMVRTDWTSTTNLVRSDGVGLHFPWKMIKSEYHLTRGPNEPFGHNQPANNENIGNSSVLNIVGDVNYSSVQNKCLMGAKKHRILSHRINQLKLYDIVVWVDGSRSITNHHLYEDIIEQFKDPQTSMVFFEHATKSTVFEEVLEASKQPRYVAQGVHEQYLYYLNNGFPDYSGRFEYSDVCTGKRSTAINLNDLELDYAIYANTAVMDTSAFAYRINNARSALVLDSWWAHNVMYSFEDQVSLAFVLWDYCNVVASRAVRRLSISNFIGPRNPYNPHA